MTSDRERYIHFLKVHAQLFESIGELGLAKWMRDLIGLVEEAK